MATKDNTQSWIKAVFTFPFFMLSVFFIALFVGIVEFFKRFIEETKIAWENMIKIIEEK